MVGDKRVRRGVQIGSHLSVVCYCLNGNIEHVNSCLLFVCQYNVNLWLNHVLNSLRPVYIQIYDKLHHEIVV